MICSKYKCENDTLPVIDSRRSESPVGLVGGLLNCYILNVGLNIFLSLIKNNFDFGEEL